MKRILLTTTSLILAAGVAHSEVTFSGKGEIGVSRTSAVKASARSGGILTKTGAKSGTQAGYVYTSGTGVVATAATTVTASTALTRAEAADRVAMAAAAVTAAEVALATTTAANKAIALGASRAATGTAREADETDLANAQAALLVAQAMLAAETGTAAVAAVKVGKNVVYSGYDLDVAVSGATDNGTTFSMGFDMGAGQIADRDDDRVLDNMGTTIAPSALTIGSGGMTYVIGQDEIDDLYDDSQNGDVSIAGSMGGVSFTIVTDLDKETKAVAASTAATTVGTTRAAGTTYISAAGAATTGAGTIATGDSDARGTVYTAATAAGPYEPTSLKVSGTAGAAAWSFVTTNKNDTGDAASALNLSFAAGDALSFAINHDTKGKASAINKLTATYVMDAITLSLSAADDKDAAGQGGKASRNMSIGYAAGPMTATFATDEQSAWSVVGQYDLGGGAQAFATMDSTEFAVLGLSFAF